MKNIEQKIKEITEKTDRLSFVVEEISKIYSWFSETDYYSNKIITEEWAKSDSRWVSYKTERTEKRTQLDSLIAEKETLEKELEGKSIGDLLRFLK